MKLELKHLAPYLPYGVHLMNNYGNWHNTTLHKSISIYEMLEMKPMLRPLSDLNKREYSEVLENWEYIIDKELTSEIMWYEWECLFEWHFDVFGLIEKGLAIDINTLEV